MGELPFDSRMGRRIGVALGLCAVVPVLAFAAVAARDAWVALTLIVVIALASAAVASLYLTRGYAPALRALAEGLRTLRTRQFAPLEVSAVDETKLLVDEFNRTAVNLGEQIHALETLAQIDHLLLRSVDLEHVLDAIMSHLQSLTHCQSVGITLRDADAPGRGRVFLTASGLSEQPVSRIALDGDMLQALAQQSSGITVVRCEESRHSFLKPLADTGATLFWVWPVIVAERLEAILAVGYLEAPTADPVVAQCGAKFADRLAVALSKSARDEHLFRQAHYDPLTALPNRLLFRDRVAQEVPQPTAGGAAA